MKTMPNRSTRRWMPTAILMALASGIAPLPSTSAAEPTTASAPALSAEVRQRLIGQWLRPDGGYILSIESVGEDGKITATYLNPRPINVFKAQATSEAGKVALYVELRDRGYPGNNYTLTYDTAHDQLVGIYHHLGIGQNFDVFFEHISKDAKPKE